MSRLLPSNKRYTLALGLILVAAAIFIPLYTSTLNPAYSNQNSIQDLLRSDSGFDMHTLLGRPIVERDGKLLLWARGNPNSDDAKWLDVTESLIDPRVCSRRAQAPTPCFSAC